jgi:lysophospholipase L1-like esterase
MVWEGGAMIKRTLLSLALLALLAAPAQSQPAPARGPERFAKEIEAFAAADKAAMPARCEILFLGSSTIRRWTSLTQDMAPIPVINRGFGGSQTADVNYYFERIVTSYHPRAIVFYEGDNDISAGKSPYQVLADFQKFMRLKTRRLGSTPVLFISIKPSKRRLGQFARQVEANMKVREYAAKRADLFYVDVVDAMMNDGLPKDLYVSDGLHMTAQGYGIWTPIVTAALRNTGALDRKCR